MKPQKPFTFPKSKTPISPKAIPVTPEEKILKQFATKPVVRAPKVSNKSLTKPLKSYLP
jgi:hypothetical protein